MAEANPDALARRGKQVVAIGLGALIVALSAWLYLTPWVTETVDVGYTTEALRNPLLAAEQFLERLQVPLERPEGMELLDALPDESHVLLLTGSRRGMSERRAQALEAWVARGGRLVIVAGSFFDDDVGASEDRLLDMFGVRLYSAGDDLDAEPDIGDDFVELLERFVDASECGSVDAVARIRLAGDPQTVAVTFDDGRYLYFDGDRSASYAESSAGPQMLYVLYGRGAVAVLTTARGLAQSLDRLF